MKFKDLRFFEEEKKIKVIFLKIYHFYLDKKDLDKIGKYTIKRNSIEINPKKFNFLLNKGFQNLRSSINNKPALYVHKNSGIPLIGSNSFGIIDRGTNMIEVKPLTTCNIDCIFCSVDHTKRLSDIVVERDYLIHELKKVIQIKENKVNIHIGSQGDPSLYGDLIGLVKDIRKIEQVNAISMVTNGIIITKSYADKLIKAGLTHFHISLHTLDESKADQLANAKYPVKKVMEVCKYIAKNANLLLVPVWVSGLNDEDVEQVILFAKKLNAKVGVQNFLEHKFGKKPVNPIPMKLFMQKIHALEKKHNIDLTSLEGDLEIKPDNKLKKPFKKGQMIEVNIKAKARLSNSVLAVAKDRVVTVINCTKEKGKIRVKLIRDKDNIFVGTPVR